MARASRRQVPSSWGRRRRQQVRVSARRHRPVEPLRRSPLVVSSDLAGPVRTSERRSGDDRHAARPGAAAVYPLRCEPGPVCAVPAVPEIRPRRDRLRRRHSLTVAPAPVPHRSSGLRRAAGSAAAADQPPTAVAGPRNQNSSVLTSTCEARLERASSFLGHVAPSWPMCGPVGVARFVAQCADDHWSLACPWCELREVCQEPRRTPSSANVCPA